MNTKKRNLAVLALAILLSSCYKNGYDSLYKGQTNYRNVYIVDTIEVEDPIVLVRKKGGSFVIPRKILDGNKLDEHLLSRPDVFIQGTNFYAGADTSFARKYEYDDNDGCGSKRLPELENSTFEVYEFRVKSVRFILALVNVNHYNRVYN